MFSTPPAFPLRKHAPYQGEEQDGPSCGQSLHSVNELVNIYNARLDPGSRVFVIFFVAAPCLGASSEVPLLAT